MSAQALTERLSVGEAGNERGENCQERVGKRKKAYRAGLLNIESYKSVSAEENESGNAEAGCARDAGYSKSVLCNFPN